MSPRFKIPPGDVPPTAAAKHMGMDASTFALKLPELLGRGFPAPDETTGNFDLDAIKEWRRLRHQRACPQLQSNPLQPSTPAGDGRSTRERLRAVTGG